MNELALFAGAGGGILGGHLLGWQCVCAVEIEDYARRVLLARQRDGMLPRFPIWDDITTFDGHPWRGRIDVISGGFPCQDISAAGKGAGITGERSGLWTHMARVIGEVRPRYVLVENSPLLVSRGLDTVLCDLASLGYDARWGIVGAHHAGAPHKRDRIWIVADSANHGAGRRKQQPERREGAGHVADRSSERHRTADDEVRAGRNAAEHGGADVADASSQGRGWSKQPGALRDEWNRSATHGSIAECGGVPGFVLQRIKYAFECSQCECCEEPWCDEHAEHYSDCDCIGPSEAEDKGFDIVEIDGIEYARIYDTNITGLEGHDKDAESPEWIHPVARERYWWQSEPDVGRVAHGVASRVDRLKAIGNGQVPAVVRLAWELLT